MCRKQTGHGILLEFLKTNNYSIALIEDDIGYFFRLRDGYGNNWNAIDIKEAWKYRKYPVPHGFPVKDFNMFCNFEKVKYYFNV